MLFQQHNTGVAVVLLLLLCNPVGSTRTTGSTASAGAAAPTAQCPPGRENLSRYISEKSRAVLPSVCAAPAAAAAAALITQQPLGRRLWQQS